jgi:hypothetical protein
MSAFAAGERYINRVRSASTDGYVDEVRNYLDRATLQLREARALFVKLQQRYQSGLSPVQNKTEHHVSDSTSDLYDK